MNVCFITLNKNFHFTTVGVEEVLLTVCKLSSYVFRIREELFKYKLELQCWQRVNISKIIQCFCFLWLWIQLTTRDQMSNLTEHFPHLQMLTRTFSHVLEVELQEAFCFCQFELNVRPFTLPTSFCWCLPEVVSPSAPYISVPQMSPFHWVIKR